MADVKKVATRASYGEALIELAAERTRAETAEAAHHGIDHALRERAGERDKRGRADDLRFSVGNCRYHEEGRRRHKRGYLPDPSVGGRDQGVKVPVGHRSHKL